MKAIGSQLGVVFLPINRSRHKVGYPVEHEMANAEEVLDFRSQSMSTDAALFSRTNTARIVRGQGGEQEAGGGETRTWVTNARKLRDRSAIKICLTTGGGFLVSASSVSLNRPTKFTSLFGARNERQRMLL